MVDDTQKSRDKLTQLLRRLDSVVYHYVENGEFKTFSQSGADYTNYDKLKGSAKADKSGFTPIECCQETIPFS